MLNRYSNSGSNDLFAIANTQHTNALSFCACTGLWFSICLFGFVCKIDLINFVCLTVCAIVCVHLLFFGILIWFHFRLRLFICCCFLFVRKANNNNRWVALEMRLREYRIIRLRACHTSFERIYLFCITLNTRCKQIHIADRRQHTRTITHSQ